MSTVTLLILPGRCFTGTILNVSMAEIGEKFGQFRPNPNGPGYGAGAAYGVRVPLLKTRLSPVRFAPNLFAEQVIYVTSAY